MSVEQLGVGLGLRLGLSLDVVGAVAAVLGGHVLALRLECDFLVCEYDILALLLDLGCADLVGEDLIDRGAVGDVVDNRMVNIRDDTVVAVQEGVGLGIGLGIGLSGGSRPAQGEEREQNQDL